MKSGVHKKSQTSSVTTHMQAAAAFPQDHHGCQHCAVVVVHMGQQSTYLENYQTLDCLVSQNHVLPKVGFLEALTWNDRHLPFVQI